MNAVLQWMKIRMGMSIPITVRVFGSGDHLWHPFFGAEIDCYCPTTDCQLDVLSDGASDC